MKNDRHDIIIERNVDCPMRDGTIIDGRTVLPARRSCIALLMERCTRPTSPP